MPRKKKQTVEGWEHLPDATQQELAEFQRALEERKQRGKEALRLYQPMPFQEEFHSTRARRCIIRKGNRVGGSLALFVEIARAVLGLDPHDKYPKKGTCVCLGWGERHIGTVIHRMLFRPGAFHIKKQGGVWIPCSQDDEGAEPAPPLIPRKYYEEPAWVTKKDHIFSRIDVKNPITGTEWEIYGCNSKGDPNMLQGINVNLYAIDEDIDNQGWFVEAMMRTTAVNGYIRWAALPQCTNDAMVQLLEECEDQAGEDEPTAICIRASMWDNQYTSEKSKKEDIKSLSMLGDDVMNRRVSGDFDMSPRRVYPDFDKKRHAAIVDDPVTEVQRILKENNGLPPHEWCRYATLDPGHTVFAILYWAVPPKELGDYRIIYDESYLKQCNAEMFGKEFERKVKNYCFQDFIIDEHGARLTDFGSGLRPRRQYEAQLKKRRLHCEWSGASFSSAPDDVQFRENALRMMLLPGEEGVPTLQVVMHKCPNFVREITRFRKKTRNSGGEVIVLDEADRRMPCHAVECFDEKTEVLTNSGWKAFPVVTEDDRLATVNLDRDELEYQHPTRIVQRHHSGEMVHFQGQSQDWLVTPNHRMVFSSVHSARSGEREWSFREATDVNHRGSFKTAPSVWRGVERDAILVPRTSLDRGRRVCAEKEVDPGDFAEFLGWYMAEGSADATVRCPGKGYRVTVSQVKPQPKVILGSLLSRLPWHFIETPNGFVCSSKQLWEHLRPFGDKHHKHVPDWVKESTPDVIRRFVIGYMLGDGWTQNGTMRSASVSKELSDGVQELFLKLGKAANLTTRVRHIGKTRHTRDGRSVTSRHPLYQIVELKNNYRGLCDSKLTPTFSHVPFDGQVYCATVPNGTLVVRRSGFPLVAGNCGEYGAAHGLKYVKPPYAPRNEDFVDFVMRGRKQRAMQRRIMAGGGRESIFLGPRGA